MSGNLVLRQQFADKEVHYEQAFQLARYLHDDDITAAQVAAVAITNLPFAQEKQKRRSKYRIKAARTRSYADDSVLISRLVFRASEPYEIREESAKRELDPSILAIRFVKHIIMLTLDRNSFYATVGVCRILHSYSSAEAMSIYSYIAPERSMRKDEHQIRRAKALLMERLSKRFSRFLTVESTHHSENIFSPDSGEHSELVRNALRTFAPRNLEHTPPSYFEMINQEVAQGRRWQEDLNDDAESRDAELKRFHAVIEPDCFEQLAARLSLDPPRSRERIPAFSIGNPNGELSTNAT